MRNLMNDVTAFHVVTDSPVATELTVPPWDRRALRFSLHRQEYEQVQKALLDNNLVEIADGLADLIYVLVGTAIEYGMPLDRIWDEVQRANMSKVDPVTGKVIKDSQGKVLKPPGWREPDIAGILGELPST